jgi:hypothetical protein
MMPIMKASSNKTPEHTTKCIYHKGFSGYSSVVTRFNFSYNLIGNRQQKHTAQRYGAF